MSIHVYSDESWFPDHKVQTVWFVYGSWSDCKQLASTVTKICEQYDCPSVKRSKIRAKKQLFSCADAILWQATQRLSEHKNRGMLVTSKGDIYHQYKSFFEYLKEIGKWLFSFFPDKNLTLQWHKEQHLFSWDVRFLEIQPVQMNNAPLLIVADLLAGMVREAKERPDTFKSDLSLVLYKPDYYKVALRKKHHALTWNGIGENRFQVNWEKLL